MARVLVVDDQKVPRAAVGAMLAGAGHEVQAAASGPEGIDRARAWRPDVIVLDLHMPGMDGFEVVGHLKEDTSTAAIPVVFLTAESPSDELVVRGLDLGAADFLNKGCSRAELLARVGVMARIKRGYDEMAALARVSGLAVETQDPQALADRLAEQVARVFRADASLLVLPGDASEPDVRAGFGIRTDDPRFFVLVDLLLERFACGPEAPVIVLEDAATVTAGAGLAFESAAGMCVQRPGRRPMLLAAFAHDPAVFHDRGDIRLMEVVGRQATLALDAAVLAAQARAQARTLEQQAAALERAMTERSRFFASMSHELRTPINAILGYGELLRDGIYGSLETPQAGAVGRVVGSARHLLELVNDVLDISKLEAGKVEVVPEPVDLAFLLRDVATSVELQAAEKGLDLSVHVPDRLQVVTDAGRVRQIVLNLLSNAVKFTDEGSVRAVLGCSGPWASIQVIDTGVGIASEDQERVFREFEQTGAGAGRGGTGLGLAISRRLAELLGGGLTLESEPGTGSTFTVHLPLRRPVGS